jgi:hypothetical protein
MKDNVVKRGWSGDETCRFFCCEESIKHIFFDYVLARYVWAVVACVFYIYILPSSMDDLCKGTEF